MLTSTQTKNLFGEPIVAMNHMCHGFCREDKMLCASSTVECVLLIRNRIYHRGLLKLLNTVWTLQVHLLICNTCTFTKVKDNKIN